MPSSLSLPSSAWARAETEVASRCSTGRRGCIGRRDRSRAGIAGLTGGAGRTRGTATWPTQTIPASGSSAGIIRRNRRRGGEALRDRDHSELVMVASS